MEQIESFHAENLAHGLEGSMVKANVPYELKRSYSWMKIKPTLDMDVKVIGMTQGEGKYTGMVGALICETPEGKTFHLGSGFSDEERTIWNETLVGCNCELTYQELTIDGIPRFARFKRWRPDKEQP
jgi:DNA ligase-1